MNKNDILALINDQISAVETQLTKPNQEYELLKSACRNRVFELFAANPSFENTDDTALQDALKNLSKKRQEIEALKLKKQNLLKVEAMIQDDVRHFVRLKEILESLEAETAIQSL